MSSSFATSLLSPVLDTISMASEQYPSDKKGFMAKSPSDPCKVVKNGTLCYHKNRDARFPYLYKVESHPLVHNTDVIKHIYVYVEDTRNAAMRVKRLFEKDLKVPLGPDKSMAGHGMPIKISM